jgi:hypothetical protein
MKILVKAVAGSHLFGTNTPSSDHDYKGIFLPSADDILLGKFDQTIHQKTNNTNTKNTKDDVDIEFYSLDKFFAWELLFTPDEFIIEKHPLWDTIRADAPKFVNKKVDAFIGYCRQQAHKYGVRGSRMDTLERVIRIFDQYDDWVELCEIDQLHFNYILSLEHVEFKPDKNGKDLLHICGKKFGMNTDIGYISQPLEKYYKEYGERSRKAKDNEGIDWKALSHAVRVCMQAISLLTYGKIELPMNQRNVWLLKKIKAGEMTFGEVAEAIEMYQDELLEAVEESTLPEQPNLEAFQDVQKRIYTMVVKGEV